MALVTHAGGELGRAVALGLARGGARLALLHAAGSGHGVLRGGAHDYVDPDAEIELTRALLVSEGAQAIVVPGDPSGTECCLEAVRRTVRRWGSVDIVVVDASDRRFADAGPLLRAVRPYLGRGATLASVVRTPTGTVLVEHASRSLVPAGSTRATLDALGLAGLTATAGVVPDGRFPFDASAADAAALRGLGRHALSLADARPASIASCVLRLASADARWSAAERRAAGTAGSTRGL